jgi:hypothetical protein
LAWPVCGMLVFSSSLVSGAGVACVGVAASPLLGADVPGDGVDAVGGGCGGAGTGAPDAAGGGVSTFGSGVLSQATSNTNEATLNTSTLLLAFMLTSLRNVMLERQKV